MAKFLEQYPVKSTDCYFSLDMLKSNCRSIREILAPASLSELILVGHCYMPFIYKYSDAFDSSHLKDGSSKGDLRCALPSLLP